jgi:phosphoribosylanthranilate isomerase
VSTKVKICGITRPQDATAVVGAGADALGLNFTEASPRYVCPEIAAEISLETAGAVCRAGLFVDADRLEVETVLRLVPLDLLQFHGDEDGAFCAAFGIPYMKAVRMRGAVDIAKLEDEYEDACCLLLDAYVGGTSGGTGTRFDLSLWPRQARKRLVLAGGLTVDNVAAAVRRVRPYGVDVSGGVEGSRKGEKDSERIARFVSEVKRVGK